MAQSVGMPVVLELAGGPGIGLGHLHRGFALAQDLENVRYILTPDMWDQAVSMGVDPALILPNKLSLHDAAVVVLDTLFHGNADATAARIAYLRARGHISVLIDSMPPDHLPAMDAATSPDLLITPYLNAGLLRAIPACHWLQGAEYAMLHPAYRVAHAQSAQDNPRAILVACGGADPSGLSRLIAEICIKSLHPVDLVIGPQFAPGLVADLRAIAARTPLINLHEGQATLLPLYRRSALVLGRPGLMRYEAACLGRSGVYLWDRTEYMSYFSAMQQSGLAEIYLAAKPGEQAAFVDRVAQLVVAPTLPKVPHLPAQSLVDGAGTLRVAIAVRQLQNRAHTGGAA